jgi:hypothetical protein
MAFARVNMFKSAVVSDCLMMAGKFAGLGVGSLARLSRGGITENHHIGAAVNRPFFLQVSFAPTTPNEINAPAFMRHAHPIATLATPESRSRI